MSSLMTDTYKTAAAAAATGHGNFGVFKNNFYANAKNVLPRFSDAGRGEYNYAQIAEMAIHIAITGKRTRDSAHMATWGILDTIYMKSLNTKRVHENMSAISARFDELEFAQHTPRSLGALVIAPELFFGADVISRDPDNRTHAMFRLSHDAMKADAKLVQEFDQNGEALSLADFRKNYRDLCLSDYSERDRHFAEPMTFYPDFIDLTAIFLRFEGDLNRRTMHWVS